MSTLEGSRREIAAEARSRQIAVNKSVPRIPGRFMFALGERMTFYVASNMGDAAAINILLDHPDRRPIRSVPAFWSDQYNVKIKSAGFLRGADVLTLVSEDADKPSLLIEASNSGKVVGAIAFNMNRAMIGYQRDLAVMS